MRPSSPTLFTFPQQLGSAGILWFAVSILAAPPGSAQKRGTVELSPVAAIHIPTRTIRGGCFPGFLRGPDGQLIAPSCEPSPTHVAAVGGRATVWRNERIGIEGSLWRSPGSTVDNFVAGDVRVVVNLFGRNGTWAYFVGGPAFVSHTGVQSTFGGVVGGGAHLRLAPRLAIRPELAGFVTPPAPATRGGPDWDLMWSLGLSIALGSIPRTGSEAASSR